MEYYSAMREKEILPFVTTWVELEGVILSEVNQAEKDEYCMIPLISRIEKIQTCEKQENGGYQRMGGGG